MSLLDDHARITADLAQCDSLVANAHRTDPVGVFLFPQQDREQITVAAFLNMFIAWETFLESSICKLMSGNPTINGSLPVKYASPSDASSAASMLVGVMTYFDFGNHQKFSRILQIYFDRGYPYEPHFKGIYTYLEDLRVCFEIQGWAFLRMRFPPMATRIIAWETSMRFS